MITLCRQTLVNSKAIAVGKRIFGKNSVRKFSDSEIKCEEVAKLLRVDIDYQLNFDQHLSSLCRKAGQQLIVLKRLSPFLSKLNRLTVFYTFILFNFNNCPLACILAMKITQGNSTKFKNVF